MASERRDRYARVILDLRTRALDRTFDYAVPEGLDGQVRVGSCVLVTFAHRPAVGYVLGLGDEPSDGVDPARVLPVSQVLADPLFDEAAVGAMRWMAAEYAAPLLEVTRLFCPPGFTARTERDPRTGAWRLRRDETREVDDRWVSLTEAGASYVPPTSASRQRAVLAALSQGPVRQAELGLALSGAAAVVGALARRGVVTVERRRRVRGADEVRLSSAAAPRRDVAELTAGQRAGLAAIQRAVDARRGDVVLLDGVTGSGKTEVYLAAIERVLAAGRDACVLVPEISLTPQTVGRFRARFGDQVAVLHSRLSVGERYDQWDMVRTGVAHVVVGARSALFAPLADPGIYVIDEEHEASYKQGSVPRYHAREVAAHLARAHGAALVLGSATPSMESLARCEAGEHRGARWTRVEMPERPSARPLPPVEVVDMAREFAQGWRSMFSRALTAALAEVAEHGEKAVLMLNQRGFARWMLCRDCGYVPSCEHCSTSLTYHERGHRLVCHTCGAEYPVPAVCPECGSHFFRMSGMGTQQVEDRLREQLDALVGGTMPVIRMDADSTRAKGAHERCLEAFDAAPSAVLLGTQMIAKGLDFPDVTLVGVINADTILKVCDFRAAERTYDLLEQVAGRAGRGDKPGRVIIQTYQPDHPAIRAAAEHDRSLFMAPERAIRREAGYPPYTRLANVTCWGASRDDVVRVAGQVADELRATLADVRGAEVLGAVECVISRMQDRHRWHALAKVPAEAGDGLGARVGAAVARVRVPTGVSIAIDVDPYDML
ncbi:primosomal protein N' [bacterium]|nr:primosomal protein N' [bacterium]